MTVLAGPVKLIGDLRIPGEAHGLVLFVHGSGSGRHSPRNRQVADVLNNAGLGTLLIDLLTIEEETLDRDTGQLRFNIGFLAERVIEITDWLMRETETANLPIGYFGASTGAAAAIVAAAERPDAVNAIVSRGGRPDLAGAALSQVQVPTLLIAGGRDIPVIGLNRSALEQLGSWDKQIVIVPRATHLFEEPGTLHKAACLASNWFANHLHHATDSHPS